MSKDDKEPINLGKPLSEFLSNIRTVTKTISIVIPFLNNWRSEEIEKLNCQVEQINEDLKNESSAAKARAVSHKRKAEDFHSIDHRAAIVDSTFTYLFSNLDAFTGNLIRTIYKKKPQSFPL